MINNLINKLIIYFKNKLLIRNIFEILNYFLYFNQNIEIS